jgi:hypothetical protein
MTRRPYPNDERKKFVSSFLNINCLLYTSTEVTTNPVK